MWRWVLIGILALSLAGCDSQPTRKVKHKKQAQEESQPDPYQENSEESDEPQDPQKGYFDPLRDIKDVKKEREEELQKEKEVIDEADNQ